VLQLAARFVTSPSDTSCITQTLSNTHEDACIVQPYFVTGCSLGTLSSVWYSAVPWEVNQLCAVFITSNFATSHAVAVLSVVCGCW
jgi:hypothetical protein